MQRVELPANISMIPEGRSCMIFYTNTAGGPRISFSWAKIVADMIRKVRVSSDHFFRDIGVWCLH